MGYKVAVVGATGNVGREMLNILAERNFLAVRFDFQGAGPAVGQYVERVGRLILPYDYVAKIVMLLPQERLQRGKMFIR